ncbi:anti-sigma F factor antagonist [Caloranaerobacter ferrireducens]|uniref:anti-sigma F factor antagonist n=1 Tax=Caloranaerobacter ferrireducens TaxID=1323370 RepID=UPI00084D658F|nr:anti-sigma F factor antagonist [Caloranaerobacter ferrireducens]
MQLNFYVTGKTLVVGFSGELDHHTAENIRKEIDNYYDEKMLKNIVLDLDNLNFMDSSGIGLILGRYKKAMNNDGKLLLVNASARVKKILEMSGITKIIKIYDSVNNALDNI